MSGLTFTLGEKLGIEPRKHTDTTSERIVYDSDPCPCGRGRIEYTKIQGCRVPEHTVWNEGMTLDGRPDMSPCCKVCRDEWIAEVDRETDYA